MTVMEDVKSGSVREEDAEHKPKWRQTIGSLAEQSKKKKKRG